ncbi:MAG: hypothetical protein NZT92_13650 [Abditibacteriales bacterium]|nr:hypothetical protein [Abditibacteriales bacterium]MDW8367171.1 hypothetical protein [Abditibacteriales bacterium]
MSRGVLGCAGLVLMGLLVAMWLAPALAVRLEYRFTKGQTLTYRMTFSAESRAEVPSSPIITTAKGQLTIQQQVQEVKSNGDATLLYTFRDGQVQTATAGMTDTTIPLTFPTVQVQMNKNGQVLSTRLAEPGAAPVAQPHNMDLGGFDFNQFFGDISAVGFPNRDVQVGESWDTTSSFTAPGGEKVTVTARSTLKSLKTEQKQSIAEIQTEARTPLRMHITMLQIPAHISGAVSCRITSRFSQNEGRLLEMRGTANAQLTLNMQGLPASAPEFQNVPVHQRVTFAMTLQ